MQSRLMLHAGFLCGLAFALVAWTQVGALKTIDIDVDGSVLRYQTRQVQVANVLKEAAVVLGPSDDVTPPLAAMLAPEAAFISVRRAVPVSFTYNGGNQAVETAASSVKTLLYDRGIRPGPYDSVQLDGKAVAVTAKLARQPQQRLSAVASAESSIRLDVRTSRPVFVHDAGFVTELNTTAGTVATALANAGYAVGTQDQMRPDGESPIEAGQHIYLRRAKSISLKVAGHIRAVQTHAATVGDALQQAQVVLTPADEITPTPSTTITPGMTISIVRVTERQVTETERIPFKTEYVADADMEYGQQVTAQPGTPGQRSRVFDVKYNDGEEIRRTLVKESLDGEPQPNVIHYGTKITIRTVNTPDGPQEYWRTMRVWATWYHPGSAGKPRSHPGYGYTSIGYQVHRGIIAVDPTVIPYYTQMYVPGYGVGMAADTGGGVKGAFIDLGFSDDEEHDWHGARYVDIYILGPGPSTVSPPRG